MQKTRRNKTNRRNTKRKVSRRRTNRRTNRRHNRINKKIKRSLKKYRKGGGTHCHGKSMDDCPNTSIIRNTEGPKCMWVETANRCCATSNCKDLWKKPGTAVRAHYGEWYDAREKKKEAAAAELKLYEDLLEQQKAAGHARVAQRLAEALAAEKKKKQEKLDRAQRQQEADDFARTPAGIEEAGLKEEAAAKDRAAAPVDDLASWAIPWRTEADVAEGREWVKKHAEAAPLPTYD